MANVMDAAKNLLFPSDQVINNLFPNICGGVERECERQKVL